MATHTTDRSPFTLRHVGDGVTAVGFVAMASPCELLIDTDDAITALTLARLAAGEVWRIEQKYSRYSHTSELSRLNRCAGQWCHVDSETALLLDFAFTCHAASEGRFDITSGILRRVWQFDGSDRIPAATDIEALLPAIGLDKVVWKAPDLHLAPGMELDFGGIGKEYAADRALALVASQSELAVLINLGGDLCCRGVPASGQWQVGIENPSATGNAKRLLNLGAGALATSGDTHRYLQKNGVRYGHILDPRTGWPVMGGPASVTVASSHCLHAGMLATLALLHGEHARTFLEAQGIHFWITEADTPCSPAS